MVSLHRMVSPPVRTILAVILFTIGAVWYMYWHDLQYRYYMYRLSHTNEGGAIVDYDESIGRIAPYVVPLLVNTYEDINAHPNNRSAAAFGLIKVNKNMAEDLFIRFLPSKDDNVVIRAIWDLLAVDSMKGYEKILALRYSNNPNVRKAVVKYMSIIKTKESVLVLEQMISSDADEDVKITARNSLWEINKSIKDIGNK